MKKDYPIYHPKPDFVNREHHLLPRYPELNTLKERNFNLNGTENYEESEKGNII